MRIRESFARDACSIQPASWRLFDIVACVIFSYSFWISLSTYLLFKYCVLFTCFTRCQFKSNNSSIRAVGVLRVYSTLLSWYAEGHNQERSTQLSHQVLWHSVAGLLSRLEIH